MSDEWDQASTRAAVKGRSGGVCELCQKQRATDMHHRKSAGTGGGWHPANILHLCAWCHRLGARNVTSHSSRYERGACLRHGDNPETTVVIRDDGTLFQPTDDVLKAGKNA